MELRMKILKLWGLSEKFEVHEKPIHRGDCLTGILDSFQIYGGGLSEEEEHGVFDGGRQGDTPMHTILIGLILWKTSQLAADIQKKVQLLCCYWLTLIVVMTVAYVQLCFILKIWRKVWVSQHRPLLLINYLSWKLLK